MAAPRVVILAGPNGAGKSTSAPQLLPGLLGVTEFVNADVIAHGLSAYAPESAAIEAGKIMLRRLRELADAKADFAFETTLASKSFAPWLNALIADGYEVRLAFLYLPSPEMSIARVAQRVERGGHFVPDDTVRRRYHRGLSNLLHLYRPIAARWDVFDNHEPAAMRLIASGRFEVDDVVLDPALWQTIRNTYDESQSRHK